ncbi:MAG: hypothetical protein KatS3mg105_2047 [Gemmatales bacterium]|nr:MAG: hypothetical protein KatS3mg105_2047 [Gemmatales bacterium]
MRMGNRLVLKRENIMSTGRKERFIIGGADLECLFGYEELNLADTKAVCITLMDRHDLELDKDEPFTVSDVNFSEYVRLPCSSVCRC